MNDLRDGRELRRIYPWDDLSKKGDSFEWDNINDAPRIRAAAAPRKYRVSVRTQGDKLLVVRVS